MASDPWLQNNLIPSAVLTAPRDKRIHLVAVGGVAMSGLASMLKAIGAVVTGSDDSLYPPVRDLLLDLGIPLRQGFAETNLQPPPDLAVIGNKVTRSNPEVQAILQHSIPFVSLPQALREFFLVGKHRCVVAGTHGKTTSTAMLAWVLEQEGWAPGFLIGGKPLDFPGNARLAEGEYFVIEGDEYDSAFFDKRPKFLHYAPDSLLLTAVEFDHADIYSDLEAVKRAFRELLSVTPEDANVVVSADFPHALDVSRSRQQCVTFGTSEAAQWRIVGFYDEGNGSFFDLYHRGHAVAHVRLGLPGLMNARNAAGVIALGAALGIPPNRSAQALATFRGVARRQEMVGEFRGVLLVDDFAHHPTAVRATLEAMRARYPGRRLWAVFEPRSNTSRRKVFQAEYAGALALADRVIVGGVVRKETDRIDEDHLFSPEQLVADLKQRNVSARHFSDVDTIAIALCRNVRRGDLVVLLSNGDFGGLRTKLVEAWTR